MKKNIEMKNVVANNKEENTMMEKRFSFYELALFLKGNMKGDESFAEVFADELGGIKGPLGNHYRGLTEFDLYGCGDDDKIIDYEWSIPSTAELMNELSMIFIELNGKKVSHVWVQVPSDAWVPEHKVNTRWRLLGRLKAQQRKYMWYAHSQIPADYMY
jgi:hypothetical protein